MEEHRAQAIRTRQAPIRRMSLLTAHGCSFIIDKSSQITSESKSESVSGYKGGWRGGGSFSPGAADVSCLPARLCFTLSS